MGMGQDGDVAMTSGSWAAVLRYMQKEATHTLPRAGHKPCGCLLLDTKSFPLMLPGSRLSTQKLRDEDWIPGRVMNECTGI